MRDLFGDEFTTEEISAFPRVLLEEKIDARIKYLKENQEAEANKKFNKEMKRKLNSKEVL